MGVRKRMLVKRGLFLPVYVYSPLFLFLRLIFFMEVRVKIIVWQCGLVDGCLPILQHASDMWGACMVYHILRNVHCNQRGYIFLSVTSIGRDLIESESKEVGRGKVKEVYRAPWLIAKAYHALSTAGSAKGNRFVSVGQRAAPASTYRWLQEAMLRRD